METGVMIFSKITDREIIALPWKVIASPIGLNLEMNGVMEIGIFHDPGLDLENLVRESQYSDLSRRIKNQNVLKNLRNTTFTSVNYSPSFQRILRLAFGSQADGSTMDWRLYDETALLLQRADAIPKKLGLQGITGKDFLEEVLSSLHQLSCWAELNKLRFNQYRIIIDSELADALPFFQRLPRPSVGDRPRTVIYQNTIGSDQPK